MTSVGFTRGDRFTPFKEMTEAQVLGWVKSQLDVEQTRPKYQGIDTSFLVATLTAAASGQGSESYTSVTNGGTITIASVGSNNLWIRFTSDLTNLTKVKVSPGTEASGFVARPYGTELALCQRYFQQFADRHMGLTASSSQTYTGGVSLTTTMRATPTLAAGASFAVGTGSVGTPALNQNATAATSSPNFAQIWNSADNWVSLTYVEFNGGLTSEL